jgi:glucose-6-phosphate 1-dehydrogenase
MYKPEDHILVIFGASGDLARRKLIPSLFDLKIKGFLPDHFAVLGTGRTDYSDESFRELMREGLSEFRKNGNDDDEREFLDMLHYIPLDPSQRNSYQALDKHMTDIRKGSGIPAKYIFYMSTPPALYSVITGFLAEQGLTRELNGDWKRVIIEKPFGLDLQSAKDLNRELLVHLDEDQVYRIDHYLGKETVQNILVTRFANGIYEPLWNRNFVDHVEVTSSESLGVGSRGGYYDTSGALRDMLQNHLLQLVALVAMEPPSRIHSREIRNEMLKVFQSLRPLSEKRIEKSVIRGQYLESKISGKKVPGYREEKGVPEDSRTETYVAMKLFIDNWRWGGVPFYIRTGKRLPTKVTEVVIHFKPSPHTLFCIGEDEYRSDNQLVIRIQPDEGILLKFGMKVPGAGYNVQDVNMDFHYSDLGDTEIPEAYERLLLDCMQGDSTLYARGDAVEEAWRFVQPVLDRWKKDDSFPLYGYPAGSWGPEVADALLEGEKQHWRYPCKNLSDDGLYCEL